jgi:superfamily II DNA/RNA helicase
LDQGAQIIVGTPGRVEAFMTAMDGQASFKELEVLVLDEADRYAFRISSFPSSKITR